MVRCSGTNDGDRVEQQTQRWWFHIHTFYYRYFCLLINWFMYNRPLYFSRLLMAEFHIDIDKYVDWSSIVLHCTQWRDPAIAEVSVKTIRSGSWCIGAESPRDNLSKCSSLSYWQSGRHVWTWSRTTGPASPSSSRSRTRAGERATSVCGTSTLARTSSRIWPTSCATPTPSAPGPCASQLLRPPGAHLGQISHHQHGQSVSLMIN